MARLDGAVVGHDEMRLRAGISYRQLDHWCRKGWVPGAAPPTRSGWRREFTAAQERRVVLLGRLVRAGLAAGAAARLAPALERDGSVDLGGGLRLVDTRRTEP